MYTEKEVIEDYGVTPQKSNILQSSYGVDKSDNIKGVNGVGIKTIESKMKFLTENGFL